MQALKKKEEKSGMQDFVPVKAGVRYLPQESVRTVERSRIQS